MKIDEITSKLAEKGLKVTPQRIIILEAIIKLKNHPTAENIFEYIRKYHPNISVATVYKVLDALVDKKLINRVKTEKDIMRYDAVMENHHHIYYSDSDKIEDYIDHELGQLLEKHFKKKNLPGIEIEDVKLQIIVKHNKAK